MLRRRLGSALAVMVAASVLVSACRNDALVPRTTSAPQRTVLSAQPVAFQHPGEAAFEDISSEVPSFAGFFLEGNTLVTLVSDLNQASAAQDAVRRVAAARATRGNDPRLATAEVAVRAVKFTFQQLKQWRDQFEQQALATLPDVVSIDLDEVRNQVAIGLADGSGTAAVEKVMTDLGAPVGSVRIDRVGQPKALQTVRDRVRPVVGGLEAVGILNGYLEKTCTYSFNATYNGTQVVLTASHCTGQMYQNDAPPSVFYQNSIWFTDRIGPEWLDPPHFGPGHRYSDAAMIKYDSSVAFTFGYIARTTWSDSTWGYSGSLTIDSLNPFRIIGEWDYAVVGEPVEKVGRTTGWTSGTITATCVEILLAGWYRDCSTEATNWADEGDSGSPVFYWNWWGTAKDVDLVGILYGRLDGISRTAFSPMGGLHRDFPGSMVMALPGPPPGLSVDIVGPHTVPATGGNPVCNWQGIVLPGGGGVEPYFFDWYVNDAWVTSGDQIDWGGPDPFKLTLQVHDSSVPVRTGERWWSIGASGDTCGNP